MDCSAFEKHQLGFVDGTLPDTLVVEMQLHLAECERCARRDTAFRRGLMVLRNLPEIEPSPDFTERLNARLRAAPEQERGWRPGNFGAMAAAALGVMAAGYLAVAASGLGGSYAEPMLAPVVASQPAQLQFHFFDEAVVMPASAGLPMWPSAMLIEQAPVQLMTAEMRLADWGW